jgi:hypothetical protein
MKIKLLFFLFCFIFAVSNANAYVGLGPLMPVIGGVITFVLIIVVAFFGLIAFPVKKLINYRRNKKNKINKEKSENKF